MAHVQNYVEKLYFIVIGSAKDTKPEEMKLQDTPSHEREPFKSDSLI